MSREESPHEEDDPQRVRDLFNRSPHPYHRPSFDSSERFSLNRPVRPAILELDGQRRSISRQHSLRASLKSNTSPSDSGTEADDEKPLLKALTAPPLRPRKGLKSLTSLDGTVSPLLSQSGHEEDQLQADNPAVVRKRSNARRQDISQSQKKIKKQGFEITRRVCEAGLFGLVCWVSLSQIDHEAIAAFRRHALIVALVYVCLIPSLIFKLYRNRQNGQRWLRIWFPASADPAVLIYPVFLPLLVAYSISSAPGDIWTNYVLSLCAIPRQVVPFQDFHVHWLLSLIPFSMGTGPSEAPLGIAREEYVLLFPLHYALMQTLYFLTTTSLLTTELQLLSIALINLLGTPKTPQSSILKALLWVGGLAMLVSCRHVLKLSVELARIPTWRLRRVGTNQRGRSTIFCAIDDSLGGFLSQRLFAKLENSDDEDNLRILPLRKFQSRPDRRPVDQRSSVKHSAVDDLEYSRNSPAFTHERQFFSQGLRQRRHTLPDSLSSLPDIHALTRTATDAISSARTRSKLILRLTLPQATVLKWLYAVFIYIASVFIILVPVRLYVQYFALEGYEPVGWALGYLFGDYQPFRMQVVLWNLDSWICLPSRDLIFFPGWAERIRHEVLGAANTRLLISAYCVAWISAGLVLVMSLSNIVEVDTRRKVFHGMMVAMFLPTIYIDPAFIALAFVLILAIFLLLDLFRASQLPPLSKPLTYFLAPYVDGRDHKGPIVISHVFLLIGCAIPLWLSLAAVEHTGIGPLTGWEIPTRDLSMVTGVICVGMGDAAASLIGRRYGRRRWPWSGGKSLEGSAAFALAVFIGLISSRVWLVVGGWPGDSNDTWMDTSLKATVAAIGASLTEAVLTGGNDNVVVPVILWLLVRGLVI